MDLSSCKVKGDYDTNRDEDIVSEFYNPVLSNALYYDRMAGFFSSSSFSVAAEGISSFISHGGKMRLIVSPYLSKEDAAILNDFVNDESAFKEKISVCLTQDIDEDFISSESSEAFGWMLSKGLLEMRLVVVTGTNGQVLSAEEIESSGIFHNKIGILKDENDNVLVFSGSINETANGWKNNIENFDVFCSWEENVSRHIEPKMETFEKYWNLGKYGHSLTIDLPDAVKNEWIKHVPSEKSELKIIKNHRRTVSPRQYQIEAIDKWFDNGCRGIFNMATGTGKTITAIFALKRLMAELKGDCITVIAVPFQHLAQNPWEDSLHKYLLNEGKNDRVIMAFGSSASWSSQALQSVVDFDMDLIDSLFFITTYDTLCSEKFLKAISRFKCKKILIADEVHNSGAETFRQGLTDQYDYRLGLSATPARYLDDEGTSFIFNYFEKEVFTFPLADAITKINPDTGESFLTPYYYYPIFVTLKDDELKQYHEYTSKISKYSIDEKTPLPVLNTYHILLVNRARILKNAAMKLESFTSMIDEYKRKGVFDYCLVYCATGKDPDDPESRMVERIVRELNKKDITNRRFTSMDKDRKSILDSFASGEVSTLVAIRCLDEGVDVPQTRNAIILSSTGNPREYIQRRGRVLRRSKGKDVARIYDYMVIPGNNCTNDERQIFLSEYRRFKEFADIALNREEDFNLIEKIIEKFGIEIDENEQ